MSVVVESSSGLNSNLLTNRQVRPVCVVNQSEARKLLPVVENLQILAVLTRKGSLKSSWRQIYFLELIDSHISRLFTILEFKDKMIALPVDSSDLIVAARLSRPLDRPLLFVLNWKDSVLGLCHTLLVFD